MRMPRAVVIGASAGGIAATRLLLAQLSAPFPWPLMLVQHIQSQHPIDFSLVYAQNSLRVVEAIDKANIVPGTLHIAPPGYHLLVESDFTLSLSVDDPVCYARPSIDVLFESAADAYGAGLVGVILTGANDDGADGLRAVKSKGGLALVQDPFTAEVRTMPEAALARVQADHVASADDLGRILRTLAKGIAS